MTAIAARRRSRPDYILRTAARGAALIGVAVVIGIVLLQVVDKGGPSGGGSSTTPTVPHSGGVTTTSQAANVRPPQEVVVLVLNGSGVAGAAATEANKLRGLGYQTATPGNAAVQQGTTVACRADFEKEAQALAKTVGQGTQVTAFPTTPPAGSENANCIVTVGKT
jgi:hypothetical protein